MSSELQANFDEYSICWSYIKISVIVSDQSGYTLTHMELGASSNCQMNESDGKSLKSQDGIQTEEEMNRHAGLGGRSSTAWGL